MPKPKKAELMEEALEAVETETEKDKLLKLHKQLTDLRVNSISDLENLIARS